MRRALRFVAFLVAATCVLLGGARAGAEEAVAEGAHWRVRSEGSEDEARELVAVLEAAWPQMESFFGAAPKLAKDERLPVRLFETADAMKSAIRAGGGVAPDSGGYYCPVARTSYAFRQPSRWYTRTLVIHEAAHQFHLRGAAAKARGMPASWWQEGLVEHLSHHTWDGATLRLGVVPPVSLEDRAGAALRAASADGFAPESVAEAALDRPLAMHLVRWMATSADGRPVAKWKDLERRLDGGEIMKARELAAALGGAAALRRKFGEWLPRVQQPFVSVFVEWDSLADDAVRGTGAVVSICRTREAADRIDAVVAPRDPAAPWRAGVVLHCAGPDDYVLAKIEGGTNWVVDRRKDGQWVREGVGAVTAPAADASGVVRWPLSAVRDGDEVRFLLAGEELARTKAARGPLGLCVDACSADFRSIVVK